MSIPASAECAPLAAGPCARRLRTEWLDVLPPQDRRARRSRLDLRRLNALMGHLQIVRHALAAAAQERAPHRLVDLGAGDGHFARRLVQAWPAQVASPELLLIDRHAMADPSVGANQVVRGWQVRPVQADVFEWLTAEPPKPGTWLLANLFLHHFTDAELTRLFEVAAQKAELLCACEPRRNRWTDLAGRMVWLAGAGAVTRHDSAASVAAGFRGTELSQRWPGCGWRLQERAAGWFSHLFVARSARVFSSEP